MSDEAALDHNLLAFPVAPEVQPLDTWDTAPTAVRGESMLITKQQIKAARALLNWTQMDLARAVGVNVTAISDIERGAGVLPGYVPLITVAFEEAGLVFVDGGVLWQPGRGPPIE